MILYMIYHDIYIIYDIIYDKYIEYLMYYNIVYLLYLVYFPNIVHSPVWLLCLSSSSESCIL